MDVSIPVSIPALFFLMSAILLLIYAFIRLVRRNSTYHRRHSHRNNTPPVPVNRNNDNNTASTFGGTSSGRGVPPPIPLKGNPTRTVSELQPSQFPICPLCRQRNNGQRQVIFWDSAKNRYHCSRGHIFGRNGKPIAQSD